MPEKEKGKVADVFKRERRTLRFRSPGLEAAFSESRQQMMCLNLSRICTIAILPILQQWIGLARGGTFDLWDNVYFVSLCILLALCLLLSTVTRLERFQQWCSFRNLEGIVIFMGLLFMVHFLDLPFNIAVILSDAEVPPRPTQHNQKMMALSALGLDSVVTCLHLALPVRWFVMVWMDALFVVSFVVTAYTLRDLSPGDVEVHVILMFTALVTGASIGLRSVETKDRVLFTSILDEKTLRAEAEFRAEMRGQRESSSERRARRGTPSVETSSTTTFGEIIRLAGIGNSQALRDIVALGEKEQWMLDSLEIDIDPNAVLGQGSFGRVMAGEFCDTPVAVKCCKTEREPDCAGVVENILNELNVLCRVRHPNIVVFCGACLDNSDSGGSLELMLVLERVSGLTLRSYVPKLRAWKPDSPRSFDQVYLMTGVCRALIYLHSRRPCLVHSDLKPSNIMVESRAAGPFPKLLDFGLSQRVTRNSTIRGGTLKYAAPEVVEPNCVPRPPIDVFALGLLLFFVSSAREPTLSLVQDRGEAAGGDSARSSGCLSSSLLLAQHQRMQWLPSTSLLRALRPLVELCCATQPDQRPSSKEVYEKLASWRAPGMPSAGAPTRHSQAQASRHIVRMHSPAGPILVVDPIQESQEEEDDGTPSMPLCDPIQEEDGDAADPDDVAVIVGTSREDATAVKRGKIRAARLAPTASPITGGRIEL